MSQETSHLQDLIDLAKEPSSDKRRERFVDICRDKDVQQLTFDSYMHKRLVRKRPMAHVRIFFKDMAHLLGIAKVA